MKSFYQFVKSYFKELSFGWLLTFLSSFGQTFLISLYVIEISKAFNITEGQFGSIYAICTVASSVIMLSIGHTVDHISIKKVTFFTVLSLAIACFLMGISPHIAFIFVGITLLRLSGQGMLSHISLTIMSKFFDKSRGKALSFSSLGYSVGEAFFPIAITFVIGLCDWRIAMFTSAGFLLLYLVRLKFTNLDHFNRQLNESRPSTWTLINDYKHMVKERKFLIIMPTSFALSFSVTAVMFYQYVFVEDKSWSVTLYASFFTVYALTRLLFTLYGGVWVDRFSAKKLYRIFLIPVTIGFLIFGFANHIYGALAFLVLMGISVGISGTVQTAVLAEVYGVEKLGAVRSLFTMFMVISTAFGPLLVGWMIDAHWNVEWIMMSISSFMLLSILNAQRIKNI